MKMSLLKGLTPPVHVRKCFVAEKAALLGKEDEKILLDACMDLAWGLQALSTALSERGVDLSRSTLERHRKGRCSCSKI
jgi:hypothetical protein